MISHALIKSGKYILTAAALSSSALLFAANLNLDNSKSTVHVVFKQMEVPVQARFKKFQAQIDYNATKPELSTAKVEIDVNSIDLPAPEYNQEVLKKEWFNAAQFAKASFISTSMKNLGAGKLEVSGNLTIKGKRLAVRFPLQVKTEAKGLSFEGNLPIKRLQFNIGEGEWKDTSMVADEVMIKFKVVTTSP
nr:YceI family protein [uncultured Undibacterium sp.]